MAFEYNSESIDWSLTRGIDSKVAYTPDGKDYLGTDHTFRISGVVWGQDGADAVAEYNRIRHALEQPRRLLRYSVDGTVVFQSDAKVDLTGGPFPEVVALEHVIGTTSFHVSLVVRTRLWGCPGAKAPRFLSNRWSERQEWGSDHLSRITRTGTLHVAQNMFADTDAARGVCTPPLARDFNRVAAEYDVQSDGCALAYRFVDQEVEAQPPASAIRIDEARYTESSPTGGIRFGQARVALVGRPRGDRRALMSLAILMCVRRIQEAGGMRGDGASIVIFSLSEDLHRNRVQAMLQTYLPQILAIPAKPAKPGEPGFWAGLKAGLVGGVGAPPVPALDATAPRFGRLDGWGAKPFGSDPTKAPDPGLRGTTSVALVSAALNDPCLAKAAGIKEAKLASSTTAASAPTGSVPAGARGAVVPDATVRVVARVEQSDDPDALYVQRMFSSLYTDCRITCRWHDIEHVAHLAPTDEAAESAFVALGAATKQLIVEYTAERVGLQPAIPPADLGPNYVLLERAKQPGETGLAADGVTPVFRTSGWMAFGVRDPKKVTDGGALPPWVVDQLREMKQIQSGNRAVVEALEKMLALGSAAAGGAEDKGILPWAGRQS